MRMAIALIISSLVLHGTATALAAAPPTAPVPKILVMDLKAERGLDEGIVKLLSELILSSFEQSGKYEVFGSTDVRRMLELEEEKVRAKGCTDDSCMVEIGAALGADLLVSSNIGRLGDSYLINMKIIDVRKAKVVGRTSKMVQGIENELVRAVSSAVSALTGQEMNLGPEARLLIKTDPPGAMIRVDGREVGVSPIPDSVAVAPGNHTISAEGPGNTAAQSMINAPEGKITEVMLFLKPKVVEMRGEPAAVTAVEPGASPRTVWGAVAVGTGGALVVSGIVLAILGKKDLDAYNGQIIPDSGLKSSGKAKGIAGYSLLGAGLAAAGVGTWLLLSDGGDEGVALVPTGGPDGGGLLLAGRW